MKVWSTSYTAFFIVTSMKTSNITDIYFFPAAYAAQHLVAGQLQIMHYGRQEVVMAYLRCYK
jgi:hypothetical protein